MAFGIFPWHRGRHSNRGKHNPPTTKLIKRFIKQAQGENTDYRRDLQTLLGMEATDRKYQL